MKLQARLAFAARSGAWLPGILLTALLLPTFPCFAAALQGRVAFQPSLGKSIPLSIVLRDEDGRSRTLGEWLQGRSAVLAPVYFDCANLCDLTLSGLDSALLGVAPDAQRSFNVLAVSIDPREQAAGLHEARTKLAAHLRNISEWRLLRADPRNVEALTSAIGFRYFYDERSRQFAHAAGIVVIDASGRLIQYFPGVRYSSAELQGALQDSRRGRVGAITHQLLLTCFDYDPSTGTYSLRIIQAMRWAGIASALLLAGGIGIAVRRERRRANLRMQRQ